MHNYTPGLLVQPAIQKAKLQTPLQPESIIGYLRGLRRMLTVKEAAKVLVRHRETVYLLIEKNGLPASKHGRSWRIDPILLAEWLEKQ
jgi:excisionase family DNA binding protein